MKNKKGVPEFKAFKFEMKDMNEDAGTFEGYAAVFSNVDEVGDRIEKGAFLRSINARDGLFPIMFSHRYQDPAIGKGIFSEDSYGLLVKGTLFKDRMQTAKDVYLNMKEKVCNSMSFMFDVIKWETERAADLTVRILKELKVYEASILNTGFSANELANVTTVKGMNFDDIENRIKAMEITLAEFKDKTPDDDFKQEIEKSIKALRQSVSELAAEEGTSDDDESAVEAKQLLESMVRTIKNDLAA